jgi:hypothetical protein
MSKRKGLAEMHQIVTKIAAAPAPRHPATPGAVTAINLPSDVLELLRMVAIKRAARAGKGRPSVSAVIVDLVEKHRHQLQGEVQ